MKNESFLKSSNYMQLAQISLVILRLEIDDITPDSPEDSAQTIQENDIYKLFSYDCKCLSFLIYLFV